MNCQAFALREVSLSREIQIHHLGVDSDENRGFRLARYGDFVP